MRDPKITGPTKSTPKRETHQRPRRSPSRPSPPTLKETWAPRSLLQVRRLRDVRRTYDGPLALAVDYMVFNVTKDNIRVRESAIDEAIFPEPPTKPKLPVPPPEEPPFSEFIESGAEMFPEVLGPIWDKINKENGTDYKLPQ